MKTKKMLERKFHLESLLAIAGWGLAIFVSLLYLREVTMDRKHAQEVSHQVALVAGNDASARVETLLLESRSYLDNGLPEHAIDRITTLWSVCHSSHEEVPPESHQLFAQAVSKLSTQAASTRSRPVQIIRPERPRVSRPLTRQEVGGSDKAAPAAPRKAPPRRASGKAHFELPSKDYPTAKKGSRVTDQPTRGPRKGRAEGRSPHARRNAGFPEPPGKVRNNPGYPEPPRARDNRERGQRQDRRDRRGPGFPAQPPRSGSFPGYDNPPSPGSVPGY